MKTKKLSKKLEFNRQTISNLTKETMKTIEGGYPISGMSECFECGTDTPYYCTGAPTHCTDYITWYLTDCTC